MTDAAVRQIIEPQTGVAFVMSKGSTLTVIDVQGEQVSDLTAFGLDQREWLSSGRSIDYNNTIALTTDHVLYSNRSNKMFTIVEDLVAVHDFLYAPCSPEMFQALYGYGPDHPSLLPQSCRQSQSVWHRGRPGADYFQHFHEYRGHDDRGAEDPSAGFEARRLHQAARRDGPDRRADGLLGGALEQLELQADRLHHRALTAVSSSLAKAPSIGERAAADFVRRCHYCVLGTVSADGDAWSRVVRFSGNRLRRRLQPPA